MSDAIMSDVAAPAPPRPVAVIDIGTTSIRMAIAEIDDQRRTFRRLDSLSQAVSLGRDTFTRGAISRGTIEECVRVLKSYRRVLQEYHVLREDQIRVVGTSAVREASNRLAFVDRVYIATGLQVEPLEDAEVNRVTYMSIQPQLQAEPSLSGAKSLVIEVGGGSTELLLVRGPNVLHSHTYRLGSLRLRRTLEALNTPPEKLRQLMETQLERTVKEIAQVAAAEGEELELIALGGDLRIAAAQLLPDWRPSSLARVSVAKLEEFADEVLALSEDEIVQRYHVSFPDAETLGPSLLAIVRLSRLLGLHSLRVSNANLRDGLLQEMAARAEWSEEFTGQIVRSAVDLATKYEVDLDHARHVAELSRQLFRQLRGEHRLDARYEVLLHVAALLHEVGLFISIRGHHKHSMYVIRHSELFGLGTRDMLLTSLIARYYRRASPQPGHEGYAELPREQRVAMSKLAALLRVAVALDETRSQRIKEFRCQVTSDGRLVITIPRIRDLSLEQLAMRQNGALFEEVYGLQVLLRGAA